MAVPVRHNGHHHLHGHLHQPSDDKLLKIIRENLTDLENALTDEEKWRLQHLRIHEKHSGHEEMHTEMLLILLTVTIFAQFGLMAWKKNHSKSYQVVTMLGVWLIPFFISLSNHYWRFIFIWLVFSCVTLLLTRKALYRPLHPTTPRMVYKWFYFTYKACCFLGLLGYFFTMGTLVGIPIIFGIRPYVVLDLAALSIFYGLYYGILGRDVAEVCADTMASHIGYYKPEGIPTRALEPGICAVCGNPQLVPVGEDGVIENTYKLSCGHTFHEFCIRGWCIVGKKQTCPYCKEKVDLKRMFCNPWEKPHVLYGQLLDWVRLMIAWQPAVFVIVQSINNYLGLK